MGRNRRNSRHFVFVAADIVRLLALIGLGLAIAVVILVGRRLFWRERL